MGQLMVPGEVAAAVITRRPELLAPLRQHVMDEGRLDADTTLNLIDLVRDAILEAQKDDEKHRAFLVRVESLRGTAKGLLTALDAMVDEMSGMSVREDDED